MILGCTLGHSAPAWTAGERLIGNRSHYLVRKIDGSEDSGKGIASRKGCSYRLVRVTRKPPRELANLYFGFRTTYLRLWLLGGY